MGELRPQGSASARCVDVLPLRPPRAVVPVQRTGGSPTDRPARPAEPRPEFRPSNGAGPASSATSHRRAWLPYVLMICALATVSAFVPPGRAQWLVPLGGVLALVALLRAVATAGGSTAPRHPLVLLAAGLTLIVVSEVLRAVGAPAADFAEPVGLSAYPFLLAGLVVLSGSRIREHAVDTVLVAAIVPSTVVAFGWLPLVEAVERWAGSAGDATWASWLLLGVDALAVAIIARLSLLFRGKPVAYQMLLAAMASMLGAHLARAVGAAVGLAPAPFGAQSLLLISFALTAGAALHPSMRPPSSAKTRADAIGRQHLLLLVTVILVGPAFALLRYGDRGSWVLLIAAGPATVSLLVVAHLARLIRERQRLEYLSTHDALTGLPNRTAFHDRLALLLGRAVGDDGPGVMFLDLDRFKHVNDSLGHEAGDELLCEVALRLRQCARADDTVARLAGDEFAVLLPAPCGPARADEVARQILASFAEPFRIAGQLLSVSPSLGIAHAPAHGTEVETLLRNADSAMYAAKAGGRNTARTFQPGMATAAQRHLLLEQRFRQAVADDELTLHYQPRVDAASRRLVGVEALVRWDHPDLGVIPPGAFIAMAEGTGAIADLGRWVLERACRDAASWQRPGRPVAVSVNVSPRQFALQDVPAVVAGALAASGLPASALELELTESMHLSDDGSVSEALHAIAALGVTCAVDDFGTGYSSIAVLRDYPIGVVKLDQSFVQPVGGADDAPLVRGVVQLAQGLGMRVVAEGVETEEQRDFLAGILCDEIQGFLVSRAVPAAHILSVVRDGDGRPAAVPALHPVILDVNERTLVELLWALEEERIGLAAAPPRETRFASVVGTAATMMAVPIVLGVGAGGGLPPVVQSGFASTLAAVGAEVPGTPFELPAPGPDDGPLVLASLPVGVTDGLVRPTAGRPQAAGPAVEEAAAVAEQPEAVSELPAEVAPAPVVQPAAPDRPAPPRGGGRPRPVDRPDGPGAPAVPPVGGGRPDGAPVVGAPGSGKPEGTPGGGRPEGTPGGGKPDGTPGGGNPGGTPGGGAGGGEPEGTPGGGNSGGTPGGGAGGGKPEGTPGGGNSGGTPGGGAGGGKPEGAPGGGNSGGAPGGGAGGGKPEGTPGAGTPAEPPGGGKPEGTSGGGKPEGTPGGGRPDSAPGAGRPEGTAGTPAETPGGGKPEGAPSGGKPEGVPGGGEPGETRGGGKPGGTPGAGKLWKDPGGDQRPLAP